MLVAAEPACAFGEQRAGRRARAPARQRSSPFAVSRTSAPPTLAASGAAFGGGVAQPRRQRLDLLEPDPALVAAADRRDPAREHALDDRDRLGDQRAGVDRALAEARLDLLASCRSIASSASAARRARRAKPSASSPSSASAAMSARSRVRA